MASIDENDRDQMKKELQGRLLKWSSFTLGTLLALFLLAQLVLNVFLYDFISSKFKEGVRKSTKEAYHIEFSDLDINILTGTISAEELVVFPDSSNFNRRYWNNVPLRFALSISEFSVQNIDYWNLWRNNHLNIESIRLINPSIDLDQKEDDEDGSGPADSFNTIIYKIVSKSFRKVTIDEITIRGGILTLYGRGNNDQPSATIDNLDFISKNIVIDSTITQRNSFTFTDNVEFTSGFAEWKIPGGLYHLTIEGAGLSSSEGTAYLNTLKLKPLYDRYEFSKQTNTEQVRLDLKIQQVTLQELDWDSLTSKSYLIAQKLTIENGHLDVFKNKRMPAVPNRRPELPHVSFKKLSFPVTIDTLAIKKSYISYSEHVPGGDKAGTVTFENLMANITSLSNSPHLLKGGHTTNMQVRTEVMGKGLLNAHFHFPMDKNNGYHTAYGTMHEMSLPDLNHIFENIGFVRINSGKINTLTFSMELTNEVSSGTVTMNYENLKIDLLDRHSEDNARKGLKSFLANALVIKSDNNTPPLREGEIHFERIKSKSIFNYWWKSLLSGLKDTIGV